MLPYMFYIQYNTSNTKINKNTINILSKKHEIQIPNGKFPYRSGNAVYLSAASVCPL